jgi:hypothetical protein
MLDTSNYNTLKINSISGTLVKTYPKSFFVRCQIGSPIFENFMDSDATYKSRKVVVLQTMLCGEKETLSELMYEKDFLELFKVGGIDE